MAATHVLETAPSAPTSLASDPKYNHGPRIKPETAEVGNIYIAFESEPTPGVLSQGMKNGIRVRIESIEHDDLGQGFNRYRITIKWEYGQDEEFTVIYGPDGRVRYSEYELYIEKPSLHHLKSPEFQSYRQTLAAERGAQGAKLKLAKNVKNAARSRRSHALSFLVREHKNAKAYKAAAEATAAAAKAAAEAAATKKILNAMAAAEKADLNAKNAYQKREAEAAAAGGAAAAAAAAPNYNSYEYVQSLYNGGRRLKTRRRTRRNKN